MLSPWRWGTASVQQDQHPLSVGNVRGVVHLRLSGRFDAILNRWKPSEDTEVATGFV